MLLSYQHVMNGLEHVIVSVTLFLVTFTHEQYKINNENVYHMFYPIRHMLDG